MAAKGSPFGSNTLGEEAGEEMGRAGLGRLQLADWLTEEQRSEGSIPVGGYHHIGTPA